MKNELRLKNKFNKKDINDLLDLYDEDWLRNINLCNIGNLSHNLTGPGLLFGATFPEEGHIAKYVTKLISTFKKLQDDPEQLQNNQIGYQFPSNDIKELYTSLYKEYSHPPFINSNDKSIQSALFDTIANRSNENRVTVVTGKMGSGKSAFVHYLYTCYRDDLIKKDSKTLLAVVKYTKAEVEGAKITEKEEWRKFFDNKTTDSILWEILNNPTDEMIKIINNCQDLIEAEFATYPITDEELKIKIRIFTSIRRRFIEGDNIGVGTIKKYPSDIKLEIIKRLHDNGFNILIVIDGFDVFSLEEIICSNQLQAFMILGEVISDKHYWQGEPDISIRYMITLRSCTFAMFLDRGQSNISDINMYSLCPAGFNQILASRAYRYELETNDEGDHNLTFFIQAIISKITLALGVSGEKDLVMIFNQNYRDLNSYIVDIILFFIHEVINKFGYVKPSEFIKKFGHKDFIDEYITHFHLVEIYLLSQSRFYRNYYCFPKSNSHHYGKENGHHGYLDNIFDYSLKMVEGINGREESLPYIIKLRVLQLLAASKIHVSAKEIKESLESLGYYLSGTLGLQSNKGEVDVESMPLDQVLRLLISGGLIKPRLDDFGDLLFTITHKGNKLLSSYLSEIRYLENIIQVSYYPDVFLEHLVSARKYDKTNLSDTLSDTLANWIRASIINIFIHINYIRILEKHENDSSNEKCDRKVFYTPFNLEVIKSSLFHIISETSFEGTYKYLNISAIHKDIEKIKRKIQSRMV